jgi:alpha,alpha-trehalase
LNPVRLKRSAVPVLRHACAFSILILLCSALHAQATQDPILTYIQQGWDSLSRSAFDCSAMRDEKVATTQVLYLPFGMIETPEIAHLRATCDVEIETLPRAIHQPGDLRPEDLPHPGLLYLPNRYVVPGGRFNEMYGWDSYFIILGLVQDHRRELARGMVDNFIFEIENYGALLNANRTYYLTRSQPPLLSSMISIIYTEELKQDPAAARKWLMHAYAAAQRDYALWNSPIHRAGDTGLARYFDLGEGPVPEMEDTSSYYPDVIRWMLAHPQSGSKYLVRESDNPSWEQRTCDAQHSQVCARAHIGQVHLSREFYRGDRAMRESGFDTSFRFGPFNGSAQDFAPVCLNSLLYKYELNMASFATDLGKSREAKEWKDRASRRRQRIDHYLRSPSEDAYFDYDFTTHRRSHYLFASTFYPLWAGAASKAQADRVLKTLSQLERAHGLSTSTLQSGMQWDEPFGWAPLQYFAVAGLRAYGFTSDAERLAAKFDGIVEQNFRNDGTIREKYDVVSGSSNVVISAGYTANVIGFGWTNGVYLQFQSWQKPDIANSEPISSNPRLDAQSETKSF